MRMHVYNVLVCMCGFFRNLGKPRDLCREPIMTCWATSTQKAGTINDLLDKFTPEAGTDFHRRGSVSGMGLGPKVKYHAQK